MTRLRSAVAEEDKKKKQLAEAKNTADTLVYTVEKSLKDYGDKISADEKREIEEALEQCKKVKDSSSDPNEIKSATDRLTTASHKLAEHIYKSAGAQPHGDGSGAEQAKKEGEEEVVEAEFEDVDKDKK